VCCPPDPPFTPPGRRSRLFDGAACSTERSVRRSGPCPADGPGAVARALGEEQRRHQGEDLRDALQGHPNELGSEVPDPIQCHIGGWESKSRGRYGNTPWLREDVRARDVMGR